MPRHIGRTERDALYGAIRLDLRHLPTVGDAIRARRFTVARLITSTFQREAVLLDDLGWQTHDERDRFELTLPDSQLAQVLMQLVSDTLVQGLDRPADAQTEREKQVVDTCRRLLHEIPPDVVVTAVEQQLPEGR